MNMNTSPSLNPLSSERVRQIGSASGCQLCFSLVSNRRPPRADSPVRNILKGLNQIWTISLNSNLSLHGTNSFGPYTSSPPAA